MTSKLVVNTIEADTGISSVSFASSISMSSTSKFHFSDAGIDIGADTNINRPAAGVLGFNINGSEKVRINSSGRIGIGVAAPQQIFHVYHASDNGLALFESGDANCRIDLKDNSGQASVEAIGDALRFSTSSSITERVRIDSSGRMGIGDNSPDRELVVKNASSNSTIKIEAKNTHTSQLFFSDTDAENVARISVFHGSGQATSNSMLFDLGGTTRLMIDSSGRLLLGTTSAYAGANMEIRSTDSGGDTQLRITNNATGANTKAGIVFTTSTGDYASGSIRYERDAGLAQGSGGNMGKYDAMIISAFAGNQGDPWGGLEQNGVYIWGQSGTGSGGYNQAIGIGTDIPPQNTNSSSGNSNGPLLACAPEGGNALTLLARTPTPAGNDDVVGINFAARNYFGTTGRSGITYQIVCQNGHGSYGDRGQLRFNPGYNGNSNNDGKGMIMEFQGHFRPTNDNAQNLGSGSIRWNTVYAANTSINNSDINLKQNIVGLSTAEMNAAGRISKIFKTYRWKESVEEKGIDKARIHTGVVAQTVKTELEAEGLDPSKYAFYCQDTGWYKDGELLGDGITHGPGVYDKLNDETPSTVGFTSTTTYAIRYVELLSFLAAYNEQRFTSIESRLTALEGS